MSACVVYHLWSDLGFQSVFVEFRGLFFFATMRLRFGGGFVFVLSGLIDLLIFAMVLVRCKAALVVVEFVAGVANDDNDTFCAIRFVCLRNGNNGNDDVDVVIELPVDAVIAVDVVDVVIAVVFFGLDLKDDFDIVKAANGFVIVLCTVTCIESKSGFFFV